MDKGSFQINSYKTIIVISDEGLPTLEDAMNFSNKSKLYPILTPTEAETKIITSLLLAFNLAVKTYLQIDDLPKYLDNVHVVDAKSIKPRAGVANRGHCFFTKAYVARRDNLGTFAQVVCHEITHLFCRSDLIIRIFKQKARYYTGGCYFYGLLESITEKLSKYVLDYALSFKLLDLDAESSANTKLLSYMPGVKLIDYLLYRHAQGNKEQYEKYTNDLFRAYLQRDSEKALQALGVKSNYERGIIKNMLPTDDSFNQARKLLQL